MAEIDDAERRGPRLYARDVHSSENATEAYRSPRIFATRFISLVSCCTSSGGRSCRNRGWSPHRVSTSSPATVDITLTNLISVPVGP